MLLSDVPRPPRKQQMDAVARQLLHLDVSDTLEMNEFEPRRHFESFRTYKTHRVPPVGLTDDSRKF